MVPKPPLGIEVVPVEEDLNTYVMWYLTHITSNPCDPDKFVSFEGRLSEEEINGLEEGKLGTVSYQIVDETKQITIQRRCERRVYGRTFFPFGTEPENEYACLLGKGIADRIELIVDRELLKRFGNEFKIMHKGTTSEYRVSQLNRLGIQMGKVYNLEDYVKIIESNVGN